MSSMRASEAVVVVDARTIDGQSRVSVRVSCLEYSYAESDSSARDFEFLNTKRRGWMPSS